MIEHSKHSSRIEDDKSTQEDNTMIQEYSLIEQVKGKGKNINKKDIITNVSLLDGNKHSESFEQRKDKLDILEQNINKIRNENLSGKNNNQFFREFRQRLDEINLDKIKISANLSQSMLGVTEVSGIPEVSTISHETNSPNNNNKNKKVSKSALIHEDEEQHLAETLRLLQGEVTKLNSEQAN